MFTSIGNAAAHVVKRSELALVIDDALGWARWELAQDYDDARARSVVAACGRLQMARFCGAHKSYRPTADEALLRDYLQLRINA